LIKYPPIRVPSDRNVYEVVGPSLLVIVTGSLIQGCEQKGLFPGYLYIT
jgi:hypothetical protein